MGVAIFSHNKFINNNYCELVSNFFSSTYWSSVYCHVSRCSSQMELYVGGTNGCVLTTSTDEHGIKIQQAAGMMSCTPQQLCDQISPKFKVKEMLQQAQTLSKRVHVKYKIMLLNTIIYAMYSQTILGAKISVAQCNLCIIISVTLGICKHRGYAEMTLYSVYLK